MSVSFVEGQLPPVFFICIIISSLRLRSFLHLNIKWSTVCSFLKGTSGCLCMWCVCQCWLGVCVWCGVFVGLCGVWCVCVWCGVYVCGVVLGVYVVLGVCAVWCA